MFDNPQQCAIIYENKRTYTIWCSTMYVNERQKSHHDKKFVAHKSFTCKTFFLNRGFSCEKPRITAKNRDNLRKDKTSCEFPNRTMSHPKSRKWDSTFRIKIHQFTISITYSVYFVYAPLHQIMLNPGMENN